MSTCRTCGAEIIWAKTRTGKSMPLDAIPVGQDVEGTCLLEDGIAYFGAFDHKPDAPRYVSHFATCPNAAKHRRK